MEGGLGASFGVDLEWFLRETPSWRGLGVVVGSGPPGSWRGLGVFLAFSRAWFWTSAISLWAGLSVSFRGGFGLVCYSSALAFWALLQKF